MDHGTLWEDGGIALLANCGEVDLRKHEVLITAESYGGRPGEYVCPNCGKKLRLVWDVRIEEVE